jgi:sterol 3beta-glucosyltransferase
MRLTILTVGSRGDVQPYVALGLGLRREGHSVTLAASGIFEPWIRGHGLEFAPVRFNPQEFLQRPDVREKFQSGNPARLLSLTRQTQPLYQSMFDDFWQACQKADHVVVTPIAYGGYDCAEKLGCPASLALLQPFGPTTEFPTFALPPRPRLGSLYNRLSHLLLEEAGWLGVRGVQNAWRRKTLGLPPLPVAASQYARMRAARAPWLYGFSPAIIPKPHDWPAESHITGYWFLNEAAGFQPPEALERFLESGPPPVYIGFGSMSNENPQRLTQLAITALRLAGQRGVLLSGWAGLSRTDLPDTVFAMESAPHDWLFPRMSALVHHGGAGTVGAGLLAGIPTVVTPFLLDQFAWGEVVWRLRAGPEPIPVRKLTAERLAAAIRAAQTDAEIRRRAAELGSRLRAEDGVARAVEVLNTAE